MSGSPSTKFVGRSFNDLTNGLGYKSEQGLAQPSATKSWLLAAHVRLNGPFFEDADNGQPLGPVLINTDSLDTPTKGILLGVACVSTDYDEQLWSVICSIFGNGAGISAGFEVKDGAAGSFGRDLFVQIWFDAEDQDLYAGYNGKLLNQANFGEAFEPASSDPTILGAVKLDSDARLNANSGLFSIESVALYEAPEDPSTLSGAQVSSAIASMAMASMKFGTLVLSDPQVPSSIEGIFAGKDWTHHWRPGAPASALAPDTLPDSGDAAQNVPLTRECAADEAPLVVADTGFAAGEAEQFTTNYWEEAGITIS